MKIYWLDCSSLMDETALMSTLPYLSEERREKTLRLQTEERRAQSAAVGLMLRHLFGHAEFCYGINGKPYLRDQKDQYFSISHSGKYVVCAVADCEIGVDIEPILPIRPAVKQRCFTAEEQQWIGEDATRFTRLWTMKEGYMKLTGTGLSVPAKKIILSMPPHDGYDSTNNCYWSLVDINHIPVSICSEKPGSAILEELTLRELTHLDNG